MPIDLSGNFYVEPKKEKPICSHCQSDNVKADSCAVWNVDRQQWEVATTFDKGAVCEVCEGGTRLEWIEVE